MLLPGEQLEDWPPAHRGALARGLRQQLIGPGSGTAWSFAEFMLDPFEPANGELYRSLRLGMETAIMLVMRTPRDPNHVYEIIGLRPPADGLGIMEYRSIGSGSDHVLIVRSACAFTRGSMVIGELQWAEGNLALDRIVNPLQARPGCERQEIAAAMAGLRVLSNLTKHAGGPAAMPDADAFEEAVRFGLEWLDANPGAEPSSFTFERLRLRRSTGPDALKKWLKKKHFGIRDVQREMARRIQRSGS